MLEFSEEKNKVTVGLTLGKNLTQELKSSHRGSRDLTDNSIFHLERSYRSKQWRGHNL